MDYATEHLPMETYNRIKRRLYIYMILSPILLQLTILFARIDLVNRIFFYTASSKVIIINTCISIKVYNNLH